MRRAFRKPPQPMGEAWFMGETRKTFDRFSEIPISEIPIQEIGPFLFELTTGISSFGEMSGEWHDWFAYALPDLILRSHESYAFHTVLEPTVSAMMNFFWERPPANYPQFEEDICATLGRCLMKPEAWTDARSPIARKILGIRGGGQPVVFWGQTSGDFSAAMFFALRTFPLDALGDFIDSVIAIESAPWRARLVTWLWGAAPLLRNGDVTARTLDKCNPPVSWENAHCIGPRDEPGAILSRERCEKTVDEFRKRLEPVLASFDFSEDPEIAEVMQSLDATGAAFDALF
jgi:hypothetical protein